MRIARVYDEPNPDDGPRVLVDRLWPRGLRKDDARIDQWCKNVAPSTDLRRWYGHRPERFEEFTRRYLAELADPEHRDAVEEIRSLGQDVTLLTAAKDIEHSQAAVLAEFFARG